MYVFPRFIGAAVLALIFAIVGLVVSWSDFATAMAIGSQPGHSVITRDFGCTGKGCTDLITYKMGDTQVSANISGPMAANVGDAVVYNPTNPQTVMLTTGWQARWWALSAGVLVPVAYLGVVFLIVTDRRRRQRAYGDLRPGLGVTGIRMAPFSKGNKWSVTFADGKTIGYGKSSLIDAIRSGLVPDLSGAEISTRDRARLGV